MSNFYLVAYGVQVRAGFGSGPVEAARDAWRLYGRSLTLIKIKPRVLDSTMKRAKAEVFLLRLHQKNRAVDADTVVDIDTKIKLLEAAWTEEWDKYQQKYHRTVLEIDDYEQVKL